jgi:signal transduction histidine kinase/ActR/RegA family two-component response regulator
LAVVLTGSLDDGARGAVAVRQAGGTVLVQSEDTAVYPDMPRAAVERGGADLVLPLHEIGSVIAEVTTGGRFPMPRDEIEAVEALFEGTGEARAALRSVEWSATLLGPVRDWSQGLRTAVTSILDARFPTCIFWGPDFVQIYNDAWLTVLGSNHPAAGVPARVTWSESWEYLQEYYERVREGGESIYLEDQPYAPVRAGLDEETYFVLSYSPVRAHSGEVAGVLTTAVETTDRVLAERRLKLLHRLAAVGTRAETVHQVCQGSGAVLSENERDLPFALLYLLDEYRIRLTLSTAVGVREGDPVAPHLVKLRGGHAVWPLRKVIVDEESALVEALPARLRDFHAGPWPLPPASALLLPLRSSDEEPPVGALVVGLSPRLPLDERYRHFLELVANQVGANVVEAQAREEERKRLEQLAEAERAKAQFFSNVSHEFRTPLTLLLAPLEELWEQRDELSPDLREEIEVAARNGRRLLTLVNFLLDFAQLEAGHLRPHFEPTDLAALTRDIVSLFRSTAERMGLELQVDCPPLPELVPVDRTMWETVVSNLLSNALKFTLEGEVGVQLRALPQHAEFVVRDTGVGIPREELPHLFERFYRVRDGRARTHEGIGIGLALVRQLVRRHRGRVRVESREGEGATFTVWIPLQQPRTPEGPFEGEREPEPMGVAADLVEEAAHWNEEGASDSAPRGAGEERREPAGTASTRKRGERSRILVVDDNADMRAYLGRLLSAQWEVESARDGEEGLRRARQAPPDLILADVMMPRMDGLGLLREIRKDEALRAVPVILVTARAGEEEMVEGLLAGADDYVAKPFSSQELIARVGARLELARMRRRSDSSATKERKSP